MKTVLCFAVLFFLATLLPAQADFKLVGKIPAPVPEPGVSIVTGLSPADSHLFVTVMGSSSSYLYLLNPGTGSIVRQKEMDGEPPDCPGDPVRLISGAYEGFGSYWVGDECGDFINVIWVFDSLAVFDSFMSDTVDVPSGLVFESDTLFAVDYDSALIVAHDLSGNVLTADTLPSLPPPTAVTLYRDHFFICSDMDDNQIFEISREATMIDTHTVDDLVGTDPLAATFYDGLLYVGSAEDSILIFEPTTYNTCIPPGDTVTVEAVPGRLFITFDKVLNECCVFVDVLETQGCPVPDSVEFTTDIYEITTCLQIDWEAQIAFEDEDEIPEHPESLRVFSMPSGTCTTFRDITVDSMETFPMFRTMSRMQSEDDEFSVFAIGLDRRKPQDVIGLKFDYTRDAIVTNEDSIPPSVYSQITALLDEAETEYLDEAPFAAAILVDSLAGIVRDTPAIPHTYYPGERDHNIAGMIISCAHTLSFSLRWYGGIIGGVPVDLAGAGPWLAVYPNPSRKTVTVEFVCDGRQPVSVDVYSPRGRLVRRLLGERAGRHRGSLTWRGDNEGGHPVSPGAYFVVVRQGDRMATKKVILQR